MNEYLIDRETLGRLIDELIKRKPLPVNSAEELPAYREKLIKELDDQICMAIFGGLNETQNAEMNELLNQNESNPEVFKNFFIRAGINLEGILANTITTFGKEYLGEQNV